MDKISRVLTSTRPVTPDLDSQSTRRTGAQSPPDSREFEQQVRRAELPSSIDRALREHRQLRDLRGWKSKEAMNAGIAAEVNKGFADTVKAPVITAESIKPVSTLPVPASSTKLMSRAEEDALLDAIAVDDTLFTEAPQAEALVLNSVFDEEPQAAQASGLPEEFRYYPKGSLIDVQA